MAPDETPGAEPADKEAGEGPGHAAGERDGNLIRRTRKPSTGSGQQPPADSNERAAPPPQSDRHRVPRAKPEYNIESQAEIHRGSKPGSRYARMTRQHDRIFERGGAEGTMRATRIIDKPRTSTARVWRNLKRVVVGAPLATDQSDEEKLPKTKALAVFSSDALSSSAYATDEILLALAAAGAGALTHSIEIALAIGVLLAIVTFSYRQTIKEYPKGGSAFIVARENLGDVGGLTAAAALSIDYILVVAVSIAAGVLAITSAFPELRDLRVELAVALVAVVTLLNLRGLRESGTIFAIPTYGFIIAFGVLLVAGFTRLFLDPGLTAEIPESVHEANAAGSLTVFILLRAFASGCAALTGVEAISDGIPAFKKPESQNAAITLVWMAVILGTLFLGITVLAHELGIQHAEEISAPAQIAKTVFGSDNPLFYLVQGFTALILILAANTSYADFPRLSSILAGSRFLPHQFTYRGDRLAFSNGIFVLGLAASILLVVFRADVTKLIPLYAFGVFVAFTLSQSGMVVHWLRKRGPGWRGSMIINGTGAVTTGVVAAIVGATKFSQGAWISMLAMFILGVMFWAIFRHYTAVGQKLEVPEGAILETRPNFRQAVLVPVDSINLAILRTVEYARTVSPNVTALHITDDHEIGQEMKRAWESTVLDVPMQVIISPYRSFVTPVLSYVDALDQADPGQYVTVVLPEFRTPFPWQRWLHNQSGRRLKAALLERPNTVIIEVPYHLGDTDVDQRASSA